MNRKEVQKRVQQYGREELMEWRKHILICLKQYEADRNQFEIEECHFLLDLIHQRLDQLAHSNHDSVNCHSENAIK